MADLSLHGLSKHYGDFYAVREVSLTIADGEFLVLLGPSGCGKTTTLRMIAGLEFPTEGSLKIFGDEIPLKAQVEIINGYSAHADRAGLTAWIDSVKAASPELGPVWLVHGEPAA